MNDPIDFDGLTYYWVLSGNQHCYRHSDETGSRYLHRDLWESRHGPIPEGHDIHHLDFNPANNADENHQCLPHGEHSSLHRDAQKNNPFQKTCAFCGASFQSAAPQARFCSERCAHQDHYRNGWSAILDYAKRYRDSHKDEIKVKNEAYRKKNKDVLATKSRERYASNRDRNIAKARAYRDKHKDEINARRRVRT